jgi:methionyl-tRNA formyltransferase
MKVTVLCSDPCHPVLPFLRRYIELHSALADFELIHERKAVQGGDLLLLIACHELIRSIECSRFRAVAVVHSSDLPEGRGWSPQVWDVLAGKDHLTVTLLDAAEKVDSGAIWKKRAVPVPKNAVFHEINEILFSAWVELIDFAIRNIDMVIKVPQGSPKGPALRRRVAEDSRIDPYRTVADQFDLLRVVDPVRYPAFMDFRGRRFKITIEPVDPLLLDESGD